MDMLTNVIALTKLSALRKPEITVSNYEIIEENGIDKISNGGFMMVITNLINNSMTADATKIIIDLQKPTEDTLVIFVTDNGHGIKTIYNGNKNHDEIFTKGVTSKDKSAKKLTIWDRVVLKFLNIDSSSETTHGVGLYNVKKILTESHGAIELIKTNNKGTVFRIDVKICKLKED